MPPTNQTNQPVSPNFSPGVAWHYHNGNDSPKVSFLNLSERVMTVAYTIPGTNAATAANYSTFFTVPFPMTLRTVTEVHATAGSDGSAVTLQIEKLTGTTAPGAGTALLKTAFNLKGAANTVVTVPTNGSTTLLFVTTSNANNVKDITFAIGDRVALLKSGTLTSVANVTVVLTFLY